ncbi:hypothetical protein HNP71_000426 [Acidocella aromatica]|uniref:Uncharacterized protein n=1 Tax=Acidocella aromatica TaxID=1303579 RepID=A0A840VPI2_9PROT|nr:hypothetical protein [Acidocella aromatica]
MDDKGRQQYAAREQHPQITPEFSQFSLLSWSSAA